MVTNVDPSRQALLDELVKIDEEALKANEAWRIAAIRWQSAVRQFAAVRDLAIERFGRSPYNNPAFREVVFPSEGRFRFHLMEPGEAIVSALQEQSEPLTLGELMEVLRGGMSMLPPRSINAALMQTRGVVKTEDDRYKYEEPDDDDIPFEN